ncbi:MAG: Ig-like domain-containing protein, partial [Bacteroidales bacterium]
VIPITSIMVTGAGGATTIAADGGALQLSAAVLPANANNKSVTWSITSGSGFASINSSTGLLTATANGSLTAKATANDGSGVYGALAITISNQVIPVTSITVTGAGGATTIAADGGTLQLSATVQPSNATNKTVTWSITNGSGSASINSTTGLVTATDNGSTTIRATSGDGSGIYGALVIEISNQLMPGVVNTPPVVVVNFDPESYSGFVSEINATGSYDVNKDLLSYTWTVPANIPVSSKSGPVIKYLGPIVSTSQKVEFILKISDGKTIQTRIIPIEILPYELELEVAEISKIEASGYQSPYYPYNIIDGNIGTMWSANGDNQWLTIELKQPFNVHHVKLAFQPGQSRESYFDVLGSEDNVSWEPILTKSASCAFSGDLQVFEFPQSKAVKEFNFVKLIGRGNSADSWNHISELKIFGYPHRNSPEYEKLAVKIYPNPAKDHVTFRIDESTLVPDFIQLINLTGSVIFRSEVDPDIREFTIPINFNKGIYIVQLISGNLTLFTQKLVVK